MTIGEKLRQLRLSLKVSQSELTQGVISITTLSRIENDKNSIEADDLIEVLQKNKVSVGGFLKEFLPIFPSIRDYELLIMQAYEKNDISKLVAFRKDPVIAKGVFKYILEDMVRVLKEEKTSYQEIIYKKVNLMRRKSEIFLWCLWCGLNLYPYPQGDFLSIAEEELKETDIRSLSNRKIYFVSKIALLLAEQADKNSERQYALSFLENLPQVSEVFKQKDKVIIR